MCWNIKLTHHCNILFFSLLFILCCSKDCPNFKVKETKKSRVIVLTDMLNEPDDGQTMVRLLMYANEMDIEGLIAVSSCHQYSGKKDILPILKDGKVVKIDTVLQDRNSVHPQEITKRVNAYGNVLENLKIHSDDWPTEAYLLSKVGSGPSGYGMDDAAIGKTTTGSKLIQEAILKPDDRPLYICINAGANTLAQALVDLQSKTDSNQLKHLLKKVKVYDDAGQDNAGAWIANTFPELHYQRSQQQVFNFMNNKGPVVWPEAEYPGKGQHLWAKEHVQTNHGPLGELYPTRMQFKRPDLFHTLEGGGTSTWIGHVNHGLYVPEEITWGGWGGRFGVDRVKNVLADQLKWANLVETENSYKPFYMYTETADKWIDPESKITYHDIGTPIYRWRRAYQNDFQARMDWCVKTYQDANHNPVAGFNGDVSNGVIYLTANVGENIKLDASASIDPDGDILSYRWYQYNEAGTFPGSISILGADAQKAEVSIPNNSKDTQVHIILEVRDNHPTVSLYDYRRIVINIE